MGISELASAEGKCIFIFNRINRLTSTSISVISTLSSFVRDVLWNKHPVIDNVSHTPTV